jgi:ketosteroid isomerase-like protein
MWEIGDTVFCQAEVLYNRRDGKVFKIPTSNIIRFKDDKIRELQAFGDPSSAFA